MFVLYYLNDLGKWIEDQQYHFLVVKKCKNLEKYKFDEQKHDCFRIKFKLQLH